MEDPAVARRLGRIIVAFPGANAQRVESLVTEKIEEQLREIGEIDYIESFSRVGVSVIVPTLRDDITDVAEVWSRVRDRLDDVSAELPPGASTPEFIDSLTEAYTFIVALSWDLESSEHHAILRRLAENLESQLRAVPGTEATELYGDPQEEILVEVSSSHLTALDLSLAQVTQQIVRTDAKVSGGQLRTANGDLVIEVEGELDTLERIRRIPIRQGGEDRLVRVGDVARVSKSALDPPTDLVLVDGKPSIAVAVRMNPGRRIDRWAQAVHEKIEAFRADLSSGITLRVLFDQSRYTKLRLDGLYRSLLLGALFVVIVVWFMMGWKSALVVGSALPLAVLMSAAGMNVLDVAIQQMSVTGLIIALGLLIDNAIVMVDEVNFELQRGERIEEAIARSVRFLAVPLLGSTLTTILAFMPIILVPGPVGEFIKPMALSVVLAISGSLFLSLTVIPALVGMIHRVGLSRQPARLWSRGFSSPKLAAFYGRALRAILDRPKLGILLALAIPVFGFVQGSRLPSQFYPPAERDQFPIDVRLPAQSSLEQTRSWVLRADKLIRRHRQVQDVHWFIGVNVPKFYYNEKEDQSGQSNFAQALVQLHSAEGSEQLIRSVQQELDEALPDALVLARQLEQGSNPYAPIEMRIFGPDLERLHALGELVRAELARVPQIIHTRATLTAGHPQLKLQLNEDAVRLVALDNVTIARQLDARLEGIVGGSVFEATEEIPVRVRIADQDRGDLRAINSFDLQTAAPRGADHAEPRWVPLSSVGHFELVPQMSNIPHREGVRCNTVQGFVTAGVLPSQALEAFQQRLERIDFQLPPGYRYEFGGESAERSEAVGNLLASTGVILVLMIATLVLCCGSFRRATIIGAVGFMSIGLGLTSLWLFGYPFGFMCIIGTMGLVGVAINDAIVVLAGLCADPAACRGDRRAIQEVVVRCTRHVLTTTATTVAGFVPLIVAGGLFWPPVAVIIAGGVVGATLLALVFVPAAYLLLIARPA